MTALAVATDPLRTMWDALHQAGCQPHGDPHKYRARCPVHQGTNTDALEAYEGADRRAIFGCYAHGCDKRGILEAIGLTWADMFPPGHHKARTSRPSQPVKPRPLTPGATFLDHLAAAGFEWCAHLLGTRCPYCDSPNAYLTVHRAGGVDVNCPEGCTSVEVRRAVETRAAIAEKGLDL